MAELTAGAVRCLLLLASVGGGVLACVRPTEACMQYVECQRPLDPSVDVERFEPGGVCWRTVQDAMACDAHCTTALHAAQRLEQPPEACLKRD